MAKITLTKQDISMPKSIIGFALDYSGFMQNNFRNGSVQEILNTFFKYFESLGYDDFKSWLFNEDYYHLQNITYLNIDNYVEKVILKNLKYRAGATRYAPVIKDILNEAMIDDDNMRRLNMRRVWSDALLPHIHFIISDLVANDRNYTISAIRAAEHTSNYFVMLGFCNENDEFIRNVIKETANMDFVPMNDPLILRNDKLFPRIISRYALWVRSEKTQKLLTNCEL